MNAPDQIIRAIIGAAIAVHRALERGLLESAYETCLAFELFERELPIEWQVELPVIYKGIRLDCGYRLDLLVDRQVVVDLKAVDQIQPIHEAKLLSCLKLSGCHIGLLINSNIRMLTQGIKRIIHQNPEPPP